MHSSLRLVTLLSVCALTAGAADYTITPGQRVDWQPALYSSIFDDLIVRSTCFDTFTPTRAVNPTNPAVTRSGLPLPRIPCAYPPASTRNPYTGGFVVNYLVTYSQFESTSIRDVGLHTISCTNRVFAFDHSRAPEPIDPGLPVGCGENRWPYEVLWDDLLPYNLTIEVRNTPPTVNVSHDGTGVISPGNNGVVRAFAAVTLDSGARDPEGGFTVSWRIVSKPTAGIATLSSTTSSVTGITFNGGEADFGVWVFECNVDDQQGERSTQTYTLRVENQTPAPPIFGPMRVLVHTNIELSSIDDDDGGHFTAFHWEALRPHSLTWETVGMPNSFTLSLPTSRESLGSWRFRLVATDNETPPLTGTGPEYAVEVYHELPTVSASGPSRIMVGQRPALLASGSDPDGGPVAIRWLVIQRPAAASGVPLGVELDAIPIASKPGTWVFRASATDDEGGNTRSAPVAVLVDAPPLARIEPPPVSVITAPFDLRDVSVDPDSECPSGMPDGFGCHVVAPEETFTPLSDGLVSWTWYVDSVPSGWEFLYPPGGRISDVFPGIGLGDTRVLHIPSGRLPFGNYRFRVKVRDAEGNASEASVSIRVTQPAMAPVSRQTMPARFLVGPGRELLTSLTLNGRGSFDWDDVPLFVVPPDGQGIGTWLWQVAPPASCTSLPSVITSTNAIFEVLPAGRVLPDECLGVWTSSLIVTDTDTPQLSGVSSQDFVIGTCAGSLCIDRPTQARPALVDSAMGGAGSVDVPIYYYVEPALAARYLTSFAAVIDIVPSGSLTPAFTLYDANASIQPPGTLNVVRWHGESSSGGLVHSGTYDVRLRLFDGVSYSPEDDLSVQSIYFENVTVAVAASSTRYADFDLLERDEDRPEFSWSATGAISVDHVRMTIARVGGAVAFDQTIESSRSSDVFSWNGRNSTGSLLPPGDYDVKVSVARGTRVLATSPPHRLTVYRLRLGPTAVPTPIRLGLNQDDDNGNLVRDDSELMVSGENDLSQVSVSVAPATLAGQLELSAGSAGIALFVGPGKSAVAPATVTFPTTSVPNFHVEGRVPGLHEVVLRFTPTGSAALPEVRREVQVAAIEFISVGGAPLSSLRPGLWENSYARDITSTPLNNPHDTFVDSDVYAFQVRVIDPGADRDPGLPDTLMIQLGTLASWPLRVGAGEEWADELTAIELREDGPHSGVFVSERQLLTVNDEHLTQPDDQLGAWSEFAGGVVADDALNDRTHRISKPGFSPINAGVTARYGTMTSSTVPVCSRAPDERKVVTLRVGVLEEPWEDSMPTGHWEPGERYLDLSTGASMMQADSTPGLDGHGPALSQANIDRYIRVANLSWAPACIEFRTSSPTATLVSAPSLIAPTSPLYDGTITINTPEHEAIFDAIRGLGLWGAPALDEVTVLFGFTNCVTSSGGCLGATVTPGYRDPTRPEVMVLLTSRPVVPSLRILSHEFGHVLTNQDVDSTWEGLNLDFFYPSAGVVSDSNYLFRHFSAATETTVRTSRDPLDGGASGNPFLKDYTP